MKKQIKGSALQWLLNNNKVFGVSADGKEGMTKREQELRQKAADTREEAQALLDEGKQKEAKAKLEEAKAAKSELDNFLALQADFKGLGNIPEPAAPKGGLDPRQPQEPKGDRDEYKAVFLKAVRGQSLSSDDSAVLDKYKARISSGTGEDGGYIIPEDIQTRINELRQSSDDLKQYVTIEGVSTNKGARTLERRADHTPFAPLSEYGDPNAMKEIESPKFDRLKYEIEDYAGFLPVPNTVLEDTDQALENYLVKWIAKKSKATSNHLILQTIETLPKVELDDYTGIKTTLNIDLDPAFSEGARIITNQDGFNYLDQLYDGNDRPLLTPDPQDATKKMLFGRRVVVLSNKTIATDTTTELDKSLAPFIIGSLEDAVVFWDRKQLSVDMTQVGGEAWRSNTTEFRAIEREDVTTWDTEAVVYGQIDITPTPVV